MRFTPPRVASARPRCAGATAARAKAMRSTIHAPRQAPISRAARPSSSTLPAAAAARPATVRVPSTAMTMVRGGQRAANTPAGMSITRVPTAISATTPAAAATLPLRLFASRGSTGRISPQPIV